MVSAWLEHSINTTPESELLSADKTNAKIKTASFEAVKPIFWALIGFVLFVVLVCILVIVMIAWQLNNETEAAMERQQTRLEIPVQILPGDFPTVCIKWQLMCRASEFGLSRPRVGDRANGITNGFDF